MPPLLTLLSLCAIHIPSDGVEIHEPALEQRPRHRLQRPVHPQVQLDPLVKVVKRVSDVPLRIQGRHPQLEFQNFGLPQAVNRGSGRPPDNFGLKTRRRHVGVEIPWV